MKNIKDMDDETWSEEPVTMYSFFPSLDDDMEAKKKTLARLVKWVLQTYDIDTAQYLELIKDSELPQMKNNKTDGE